MSTPPHETEIYNELGVPIVVNATGTKTRIGGSLIREEAVEAMADAAGAFVRLSDLQARASELITEATGAQAGYVTSGAAAGLELAAAACIARDDLSLMSKLPDTDESPSEIVMPRTHRTGYDHALRAAGADIVDIGTNDRHLGTGATNVEPWELADAITEQTAAVAFVQKEYTELSLKEVADIAHDQGVPVIVDAAAELPPVANFRRFIDAGADLVVFSGGKAIRGPQSTGIVAGREDLIVSIALQQLDMHAAAKVWDPPDGLFDTDHLNGVPRQGIGRSLKVGKEELVGLLKAMECFLEEDHDVLIAEWCERIEHVAEQLNAINGLHVSVETGDKAVAPEAVVEINPDKAGMTAVDLVTTLRQEDPRVFVGADNVRHGSFSVNPMCLTDEEADYVIKRIETVLDTE